MRLSHPERTEMARLLIRTEMAKVTMKEPQVMMNSRALRRRREVIKMVTEEAAEVVVALEEVAEAASVVIDTKVVMIAIMKRRRESQERSMEIDPIIKIDSQSPEEMMMSMEHLRRRQQSH